MNLYHNKKTIKTGEKDILYSLEIGIEKKVKFGYHTIYIFKKYLHIIWFFCFYIMWEGWPIFKVPNCFNIKHKTKGKIKK